MTKWRLLRPANAPRPMWHWSRFAMVAAFALAALALTRDAASSTATVNVSQTQIGVTPQYIGYNMGHYLPGSNTSAWVDYSDVNAFRV